MTALTFYSALSVYLLKKKLSLYLTGHWENYISKYYQPVTKMTTRKGFQRDREKEEKKDFEDILVNILQQINSIGNKMDTTNELLLLLLLRLKTLKKHMLNLWIQMKTSHSIFRSVKLFNKKLMNSHYKKKQIRLNKQESHGPHLSPDKTIQINKHI